METEETTVPFAAAERRSATRHAVQLFGSIEHAGVVEAARIEDLGANGARVCDWTGPDLRVGDAITLRFRLPPLAEPLDLTGRVRWVGAGATRTCGIAFDGGLRAREVWALERLAAGSQ